MKKIVLIMCVCFSHSAIAITYKCIQSGKTTYSSSPCGDNSQAVENHITRIDGMPNAIIQETNSIQAMPTQVVAPIQVVRPIQADALVHYCDNEEASFEYVKKVMRAGYPASASNYWHDRFVEARDAYDSCEENRQKILKK